MTDKRQPQDENSIIRQAANAASTPTARHRSATSFTRPMLTARKVFSRSFTISAVLGDETGTTVSTIRP